MIDGNLREETYWTRWDVTMVIAIQGGVQYEDLKSRESWLSIARTWNGAGYFRRRRSDNRKCTELDRQTTDIPRSSSLAGVHFSIHHFIVQKFPSLPYQSPISKNIHQNIRHIPLPTH